MAEKEGVLMSRCRDASDVPGIWAVLRSSLACSGKLEGLGPRSVPPRVTPSCTTIRGTAATYHIDTEHQRLFQFAPGRVWRIGWIGYPADFR